MNSEKLTTGASSSELTLKPVRNNYYEAKLADSVPLEQNPACSRCQNGGMIFDICSTPGDMFGGACTSCHSYGLDVECSFHRG